MTRSNMGYKHYWRPAAPSKFPEGFRFLLIDTEKRFEKLLRRFEEYDKISFDTETTGLDLLKDHIVGISASYEPKLGFYIPIRHEVGKEHNLDPKYVLDSLIDVIKRKSTIWFNWKFDRQMLEKEGYKIRDNAYWDMQPIVFLTDTNVRYPDLKSTEKHFLGWSRPNFEETAGNAGLNFSYLNPSDPATLMYAAADAISPLILARYLIPILKKECPFIVKLDNALVQSMANLEESEVRIDFEHLLKLESEINDQMLKYEKEVHNYFGMVFNLGSDAELANLIEQKGFTTGAMTPKGNRMSVSAENLLKLKDSLPAVDKVIKWKSVRHTLSSYVKPLKAEYVRRKHARFAYKLTAVPTGRLASGKDVKNKYYSPMNIQAVDKTGFVVRYAHYDPDHPDNILGWIFTEEKSDIEVEFPDPLINVRKAFTASPGHYFGRFDYASQELRIPANLSKEPVWVNAFVNGKDIHRVVAEEIWGKEAYDGNKRKKVKPVNFGCVTNSSFLNTTVGLLHPHELYTTKDVELLDRSGKSQQFLIRHEDNHDCYEVEFSTGVVDKVKKDHRYLCTDGIRQYWKCIDDILPDDYILQSIRPVEEGSESRFDFGHHLRSQADSGTVVLDANLGYLIGLYLGDGSVTLSKDTGGYAQLITRIAGRTKGKFITDEIFKSKIEVRLAVIAGLLDSDGSASGRGKVDSYIRFRNKNEGLINDFARLCASCGIITDKRIECKGRKSECFVIVFIKSYAGICQRIPSILEYKREVIHRFGLSKHSNKGYPISLEVFLKLRPIINAGGNLQLKKKISYQRAGALKQLTQFVVEDIRKLGNKWFNSNYRLDWFPVKLVRKTPCKDRIYIIETLPNHEYIANSMISHNSLYGATEWTLQRQIGCTLEEAREILNRWWRILPKLKQWVDSMKRYARRNGQVFTPFGRPRRLYHYFTHPDKKIRAFGYRTCINSPIQGGAADLIRIALIKLEKDFCTLMPDDIQFRMTVHDEIDLSISKERFTELALRVLDMMQIKRKDWPVPMDVGVDVGHSWGDLVPFKYDSENDIWIPESA